MKMGRLPNAGIAPLCASARHMFSGPRVPGSLRAGLSRPKSTGASAHTHTHTLHAFALVSGSSHGPGWALGAGARLRSCEHLVDAHPSAGHGRLFVRLVDFEAAVPHRLPASDSLSLGRDLLARPCGYCLALQSLNSSEPFEEGSPLSDRGGELLVPSEQPEGGGLGGSPGTP